MSRGRYIHLDPPIEGDLVDMRKPAINGMSDDHYQKWVKDFNRQIESYRPQIKRPPKTGANQS